MTLFKHVKCKKASEEFNDNWNPVREEQQSDIHICLTLIKFPTLKRRCFLFAYYIDVHTRMWTWVHLLHIQIDMHVCCKIDML